MIENIIIQEGGAGYQFTAKKLKTNKVGGGTCLWIPEDEVALGTKSVTANGTYKASDDGKYGFSQVTVNVAGAPGSADSSGKPISSGGEPTIGSTIIGTDPTDGETYEYSVDSQGDVTKTPVLNVDPSGAGSSIIGIDPSDGKTYEYSVDSQGGVTKTLVPTITPGGPGSGVVGTDPEDGNEYFIGIDSSGNIVKTKIPSGIEIGKTPNKTSYTEGETIDYSGIIVTLKGGDSAMFSNQDYPNGRVPFSELIFPTTTAPNGGGTSYSSGLNTGDVPQPIPTSGSIVLRFSKDSVRNVAAERVTGFKVSYQDGVAIVASSKPNDRWTFQIDDGIIYQRSFSMSYTYDGKTVYYDREFCAMQQAESGVEGGYGNVVYESPSMNTIAWTMVYGEPVGGTAEIPVRWQSPYDGRTFEDAFKITVSGTTGDTSSGSGYSDDSGGSSSGGGTNF